MYAKGNANGIVLKMVTISICCAKRGLNCRELIIENLGKFSLFDLTTNCVVIQQIQVGTHFGEHYQLVGPRKGEEGTRNP